MGKLYNDKIQNAIKAVLDLEDPSELRIIAKIALSLSERLEDKAAEEIIEARRRLVGTTATVAFVIDEQGNIIEDLQEETNYAH